MVVDTVCVAQQPDVTQQPETITRAPGRETDREILNVFPDSTTPPPKTKSQTTFQLKFSPSPSLWAEGLREENVFQAELKHKQIEQGRQDDDLHDQDDRNSFQLRLGRGGQIYSLRGPFGESLPPSWRREGGARSPWNDEVWQFVAVCTRYNLLRNLEKGKNKIDTASLDRIKALDYENLYFIHNSGAYVPNNAKIDSLYCPLLAVSQNEDSYQMLNWGLVPQVKTMHRSPILYYTKVRDAGDGIIEMTWVVHNFSVRDDIVFDHLNAPWGGTRVSNLPYKYVVTEKKELVSGSEILSEHGTINVRKTAGWDIACANTADDSPSLALVYGRDKHLESQRALRKAGEEYCQTTHSLYRAWRASEPTYQRQWKDWQTRPANSFRNFDVCEIIPKLRLEPGKSIWFRSYLVVGDKDRVMEQAESLVDEVDYGLIRFDADSTPRLQVFEKAGEVATQIENGESETIIPAMPQGIKPSEPILKKRFQLFAKPVPGSQPLFLITNTQTQRPVLTTDPYFFVQQEELDLQVPKSHPDHDYYSSVVGYSLDESNSDWQSLIGFGYKERPDTGNWTQLSNLLDEKLFPAATRFHLDLWVEVK